MKTKTFWLASSLLLMLVVNASAFYDPGLQRWINRDPIEEEGGINLLKYADNDPSNEFDLLGWSNDNAPPASVSCPTAPKNPDNPFHGFQPEKLKELFKDPKNVEKGKQLRKSFERAIDNAEKRLKDPQTENPDRYKRFIDEMKRRIRNMDDTLPKSSPRNPLPRIPWWQRIPIPIFIPIWFDPDYGRDPTTGCILA